MDHQELFDSRYMLTNEICERLCIDPSTLTAWVMRGRFPKEDVLAGQRLRLWFRSSTEPLINKINLESPARIR